VSLENELNDWSRLFQASEVNSEVTRPTASGLSQIPSEMLEEHFNPDMHYTINGPYLVFGSRTFDSTFKAVIFHQRMEGQEVGLKWGMLIGVLLVGACVLIRDWYVAPTPSPANSEATFNVPVALPKALVHQALRNASEEARNSTTVPIQYCGIGRRMLVEKGSKELCILEGDSPLWCQAKDSAQLIRNTCRAIQEGHIQ
jgi:hypothetical protein